MIAQAFQPEGLLTDDQVRQTLHTGLEKQFTGQNILVLIPDHTRTIPLPFLFRELVAILHDAQQLDFMVALGTHPPLTQAQLDALVGITEGERKGAFRHGDIQSSLGFARNLHPRRRSASSANTRDWRRALASNPGRRRQYPDQPRHSRVRSSPDSWPNLSPRSCWFFRRGKIPLSRHFRRRHDQRDPLAGGVGRVRGTIGIKETPVRDMIHAATAHVPTPLTLIALVVVGHGLAGVFIGDHLEAWSAAADLSSRKHIIWVDKPFTRVLSKAPPMYDELWTAGKAMYKLEPALAEGGELTIFAPHLDVVSHVHGRYIYEIGYHVLPYF
ncbi:MAG: DUF2088 domain-containing protein [bacterium]|nr:DUF2088 domain-containing protein [bacterium]